MRIESFPISDEVVENFIKINSEKWNADNKGKGYIFINLSMVRMQVAWVIPKLLVAKGIQEKTGATPVAITWRDNSLLTRFFESFGIKHISFDSLCKTHRLLGIKALFKTLSIVLFHKNAEAIKNMKVLGLNVGCELYEDILRTSPLSTLHTCRNKIVFKKLWHILWAMYAIDSYSKKHTPDYALIDDFAYHEAAFIKLYDKHGATIYGSSNVGYEEVTFDNKRELKKRMDVAREDYGKMLDSVTVGQIQEADKLLEDRFKGKNGREIDKGAFAGKKVLSKEEMQANLGIKNNKKTVVIMAHTFTDAVFNYGHYYFRDYYDWLDKTLAIASANENVNWLLKPHPTRGAYNESADSIEDMFARHKKSHMYWVGDEVSSESIKNVADVLVTIGGNAGAEYACFGITPIIVGKPWYAGFGYTIEPATYSEYKTLLMDIENVPSLDDKQVETAKKLFYLRNNDNRKQLGFKDELANLLNSQYKEMLEKMAISYFKENNGTEEYNDRILQSYTDYIQLHNEKDSQYYEAGKIIAT